MARFGRVITAMVTPFDASGALDLDGARRLARWLQDNGNDALVIAGTTGEAPVLTDNERLSFNRSCPQHCVPMCQTSRNSKGCRHRKDVDGCFGIGAI